MASKENVNVPIPEITPSPQPTPPTLTPKTSKTARWGFIFGMIAGIIVLLTFGIHIGCLVADYLSYINVAYIFRILAERLFGASIPFGLAGLILGIIGIVKIRRSQGALRGKARAIIGIVIGVATCGVIIYLAFILYSGGHNT